ncbi:uncharacterized protein LOC144867492 [Branchiostoma floridae x Branchiostoma japonicum]
MYQNFEESNSQPGAQEDPNLYYNYTAQHEPVHDLPPPPPLDSDDEQFLSLDTMPSLDPPPPPEGTPSHFQTSQLPPSLPPADLPSLPRPPPPTQTPTPVTQSPRHTASPQGTAGGRKKTRKLPPPPPAGPRPESARRAQRPPPRSVYVSPEPYSVSKSISSEGGKIVVYADRFIVRMTIAPGSLRTAETVSIRLQRNHLTMIKNSGLDDTLSFFHEFDCKPDYLHFAHPARVEVVSANVPLYGNFLLLGQQRSIDDEETWIDLSEDCSLQKSDMGVTFELQHFSVYILVAVVSSVTLSSASKLLLDCLNGKSFPCNFTPFIGKVSGKKHPLTIVCKEGHHASTSTPYMYHRFGRVGRSEFNLFDEEKLTVEIRHISLIDKCSDSYQINRAICNTDEGQTMDLIVKPEQEEEFICQAVIFVCRFLGAKEKKVCTLNLTPQGVRHEHEESGQVAQVLALETMVIVHAEMQSTAPGDRGREGVRKYFFFIKEKVSSDWKDLAYFLDLDDAGIRNIAGRNPDDKSCCMDMLHDWHRRQGDAATVEVLIEALSKAGLQHVVDDLKSEFPETEPEDVMPVDQN